ncbi:hypothetical protein, partial [Paenibacillus allorhizoplanae]|uniref:hypothetical protein n=1 Tax=Paenibacillus allorhizoplanae TaxID=2905648 RepID=UPI001F2D9C36
ARGRSGASLGAAGVSGAARRERRRGTRAGGPTLDADALAPAGAILIATSHHRRSPFPHSIAAEITVFYVAKFGEFQL